MCIFLIANQDTPLTFATAATGDGGLHITRKIIMSLKLSNLTDQTVSILGHPYTEGLVTLIESLRYQQAIVHFYGFQPEANSAEESILHLCRALISGRNIHLKDPIQHPSPADLIFAGQCSESIIIAPADAIGIVYALKAGLGYSCPLLDADTRLFLDKTSPAMCSQMGQILQEMCVEIPPLGAENHAEAFADVVTTFAIALQGHRTGITALDAARGFHPEM